MNAVPYKENRLIRMAATGAVPLLPAACATSPTPSPAACTVAKVADVPARLVQGALLAPGRLDRQAVRIEVDTGSQRTTVTPDIVRPLNEIASSLRSSQ